MEADKYTLIEIVLKECFWGDYDISVYQAMEKLDQHDRDFLQLLFSRIISDSSFPSAYLRQLFSTEELHELFEKTTVSGRAKQRLELARAVLFHEPWKAEPSWKRM